MTPEKNAPESAPSSNEPEAPLKRAPTLYVIIIYKLIKFSLFLALAIVLYCKSDNDLPEEFRILMTNLRIHPGNKLTICFLQPIIQLIHQTSRPRIRKIPDSIVTQFFDNLFHLLLTADS